MKTKFTILILFFLITSMQKKESIPKLVYIGDPMCSWCYGFSPELEKSLIELENKVDFELVMGGLRPYNTQTMKDLGDFLKGHWEEVNHRSGQKFKYEILKDQSFVYDTEPPSRAVLVMRKLNPEKEFEFFKAIQKAFYQENKNTNKVETYLELAKKYGIKQQTFKAEFESEELKKAIKEDFEKARKMGITGFPSMILEKNGKYHLISNGYTKAEEIVEKVLKLN